MVSLRPWTVGPHEDTDCMQCGWPLDQGDKALWYESEVTSGPVCCRTCGETQRRTDAWETETGETNATLS